MASVATITEAKSCSQFKIKFKFRDYMASIPITIKAEW